MPKNYYQILGIQSTATIAEIKKAFRSKAMEFHPDRNKTVEAHKIFIDIAEAYEILLNPETRAIYDSLIKNTGVSAIKSTVFQDSVNSSRNKAERYAKMKFNDFASKIGNVVAASVNATMSLSTLLFSSVFFFGAIWGIFNYVNNLIEGNIDSFFQVYIQPLIMVLLGVTGLVSLIQMFRGLTKGE